MELKTICVLAVALGISGFITYKTLQWAVYEEIGTGRAALFLGFAVVVFLSIANYDIIRSWTVLGTEQGTHVKSAVKNPEANTVEADHAEKEAQSVLGQRIDRLAEAYGALAQKIDEKTFNAVEDAARAKEQSERRVTVQLEALRDILLEQYLEIDHYLTMWEEKNALKREGPPVASASELEEKLDALAKSVDLPETIRALYVKRQRKYRLLTELKKVFELDSHRTDREEPVPPEAPKLPEMSEALK